MTATPKETKYVSSIHYFGPPVFSYSLKQGIRDGVPRPVQGHQGPHRPRRRGLPAGEGHGRPARARRSRTAIYNQKDFDRTLVLDDRTKLVAHKVTEFLTESGDRMQKTIIFCVDEEHARAHAPGAGEREQGPVRRQPPLRHAHHRQRHRGQAELGKLLDPESDYPVLVTTSRLLSTGVDAQTCRLIVLDAPWAR